ncbi:MAG TPA: ABC transporter ATP-binding protein [Bauldia sp.]|nr:ABC transporter ATP-binding protein [Bauldia sp.]
MTALLEVTALRKRFGGLVVANDVSLSLAAGDRTALIGPNGAGKTTLVNLITGHLRPDGGRVALAGDDITRLGPTGRVHRGLARSFQVTRLFPSMTAEEHVALALLQRAGKAERMLGNYRRMPDIVEAAHAILGELDLLGDAQSAVRQIPYGRQRMLEIAIVKAMRPKVLLLDEPAAGISHGDTHLIEATINNLDPGLAVLMIEHDMDFVFRFARRVIVMASGKVIFDGTPQEVQRSPEVRSAYLGSYADDRGAA